MPGPFNYSIQMQDPLDLVRKGFKFGTEIQDAQQTQREAEQKRLAQEAMQKDFNALAASPSAGAREYAAMAAKYPALSKQLSEGFSILEKGRQEDLTRHASEVYAALSSGKPEIALDLLDAQSTALKNSGRDAEAKNMEVMRQLIRTSPETAKVTAGLLLASTLGPDKFADSYSKIQEEGRKAELHDPAAAKEKERLALQKTAGDLGLTKAQTAKAIIEGQKLSAETAKTLLELEALKKTGGVEPTKRFEFEDRLRKEYNTRIGKYTELRGTYDVIRSSAQDASGAGDIALVTSFMKMLDPTSVVRETEFANARDTSGLLERLKNQAQKLQTGAFLDESQRQSFLRLAGQYMKAAEGHESRVRKSLQKTVDDYGLSTENIFGSAESPKSPVGEAPPASAAPSAPPENLQAVSAKTQELLQKYLPK